MKILNCFTKFRWVITEGEGSWVGICNRLKITAEASTKEELMITIQSNMSTLFEDLYYENEWNEYAFKHSIEYRVIEDEGFVDVIPSPIYLNEKDKEI